MTEIIQRAIVPLLAVLVSNLITRLITMGVLTPESASAVQKWLMDGVAFGVPAIAAWVVATYFTKKSVVQQAASLPEVTRIYAAPDLASKVDAPEIRTDPQAPSG